MKKLLLTAIISIALQLTGFAKEGSPAKQMKDYRAVSADKAQMLQEGKGKAYCPMCGMTLPMFYKTNHAATHNGHTKQYCSIHCLTEDKEVKGSNLTNLKAVDNTTLKFKDSKDMFFVVGSKKPGTMSPVSKYGFGTKAAAEKFASKFGGKVMNFDEVYALSKSKIKKEISAISKKQAKMAKMGEKIYKKMCKQTSEKFTSVQDAKAYVSSNQLCGKMKGKKLQQVALYLSGKANPAKKMKCAPGKCGGGKCGK